jgi:hypothetical protein
MGADIKIKCALRYSLASLALTAAALGQTAPDPVKIGDVTVTGSVRSRTYFWDWFTPTSGQNTYVYNTDYIRFGFSQKKEAYSWIAEFNAPILLGLPSNPNGPGTQGGLGLGSNLLAANSGQQNTAMVFPRQLNITFNRVGAKTGTLLLGRFVFQDGSEVLPKNATLATLKPLRVQQRLLGDFGFSDVGRSFDGVRYSLSLPKDDLTFMVATPTRGAFQVDGWGWNRVGFAYGAYTRQWGSGKHAADTRAFVIEYEDFRHVLKTDNRAVAVRRADSSKIRIDTYGFHSLHAFETPAGTADALFWTALQTGRWGAQQHRAYAFLVEGGLQPKILPSLKPWLRGGITHTSGDPNPNDNKHQTFFQVLPTPRAYARFPFFNMMNLNDIMGSLVLRPHKQITTSSEFHSLKLSQANDLWYAGGGVFQPWTFGFSGRATNGRASLGNLYDTSIEFRLNRHFTFTGYVGYLQGLAVMESIYPAGKDGRFGYAEVLYRF